MVSVMWIRLCVRVYVLGGGWFVCVRHEYVCEGVVVIIFMDGYAFVKYFIE